MSVQPVVADVLDALEKAGVGSVFEKAPHGWNVKWVDGGTVIHVQGATITAALGSHGAQVVHVRAEESPVEAVAEAVVAADPEPPSEPAVIDASDVVSEDVVVEAPEVVEVIDETPAAPKGKKARKRKGVS